MKKILFMIALVVSSILGGSSVYAASHDTLDLATLKPSAKSKLLEKIRDDIEIQPSRTAFENVTLLVMSVLEDSNRPVFTLDNVDSIHQTLFSLDNVDSIHQALFSLIRTRHFYKGNPSVLGELNPLTQDAHLKRMQLLCIADVARSIYDSFEQLWKDGLTSGQYSAELIEVLDENITLFAPTFIGIGHKPEYLLRKHRDFFDAAYQLHSIFSLVMTLQSFYNDLFVDQGRLGEWTAHGIEP